MYTCIYVYVCVYVRVCMLIYKYMENRHLSTDISTDLSLDLSLSPPPPLPPPLSDPTHAAPCGMCATQQSARSLCSLSALSRGARNWAL